MPRATAKAIPAKASSTKPRAKAAQAKVIATPRPWWLSDGDEECSHCGQPYAAEVEFRCPDCDGPSCPHCKSKHSDERLVCPECVTSAAGEGGSHGK
jgi:hypothetical protein